MLKLARGHATYENSELKSEEPYFMSIRPIMLMTEREQIEYFSSEHELWPEVGNREFQRMHIEDAEVINNWVIVQEHKYIYSITHKELELIIKFLIWDYLACEVKWDLGIQKTFRLIYLHLKKRIFMDDFI